MKTSSFILKLVFIFSFFLVLVSCTADELEDNNSTISQNEISPEAQPIIPKPK